MSHKNLFLLFLLFLVLCFSCKHHRKEAVVICNKHVQLELASGINGIPYIKKIYKGNKVFFEDQSSGNLIENRIFDKMFGCKTKIKNSHGWIIVEDSLFSKASSAFEVNGCKITMHVDLLKDKSSFSTFFTLSSKANSPLEICEFPVWSFSFLLNDSVDQLSYWRALDYVPQKENLDGETQISLHSKILSSDNYDGVQGNVPYWQLINPAGKLMFSLAWSGGWRASFTGNNQNIECEVFLPPSETQLTLNPGESIKGPELNIFVTDGATEAIARHDWIESRKFLAHKFYRVPNIGFPLIYNHWYAVEFDLSQAFVERQLKWFDSYGFNVFMIDAGWYKDVGAWTPSPEKFPAGQFSGAIKSIKTSGAVAGLWSCPQLLHCSEPLPGHIDYPGLYVHFMKSWLMDYEAIDFNRFLSNHIDTLTNHLGAGWWKYDQEFFAKQPRSGKMKSVIALQKAFESVRGEYPDLVIESCMGGGKMINEFTDRIAQVHWIRDGERSGYMHGVSNILEALGSAQFLSLEKVQRWNNRINEVDNLNPELLKFYCRSGMVGTWGISADLDKISPRQKEIIINETHNYRKLNELKKHNLFDINYPGEYSKTASVIFYDPTYTKAAVIVYRIFPYEKEETVTLNTLFDNNSKYIVESPDRSDITNFTGNNPEFKLKPGELSAIFFLTRAD